MLAITIVLILALCALTETRRQTREIIGRYIERGKQKIPESIQTAKEDELSLRSALHSSNVCLWIIAGFSAAELIHRIITNE